MRKWILYICLLSFMGSCANRADPEIHLIPAGYRGRVNILHEHPDGMPPKYEGKFRVYEIPSNGVLKTQFKHPDGFLYEGERLIYYVDKRGVRSPIDIVDNVEPFQDTISAQAFNFGHGGILVEECNLFVDNIYAYIVDVPKKDSSYEAFELKCKDVISK